MDYRTPALVDVLARSDPKSEAQGNERYDTFKDHTRRAIGCRCILKRLAPDPNRSFDYDEHQNAQRQYGIQDRPGPLR